MKSGRVILALVCALVLGSFAWLFRNGVEKVETEVDTGYRGAARANPLLAAERLYSALGSPARTLPGAPGKLPPADHTLVVVSPKRSLTAKRTSELLAWVGRGGRLVITLDEAPTLDPVLAHFGARAVGDKNPESGEENGTEKVEVKLRGGGTAEVQVPKAPRLLQGSREPSFAAGSAAGQFLLSFTEGAGRVTFLSDAGFLTNEHLGEGDDARLAWAIVQGADLGSTPKPPRGVWIVVREELPTLSGLLARHAWAAVLSSLLLLGAWLWCAGARFGPVLPDPPRHRRSLLEHVEASGDFLLRTGRAEDLAQSARQAFLRRVEAREPEWAKLPLPELARHLATLKGPRKGGLPPARIESALRGPILTPADLTASVQVLETLRRSL
jgi:Domain of unknown function (DUF4350)